MALDSLISGAATRLSVTDPVSGVIDLGDVESFHAREESSIEPQILMNGRVRVPKLFKWWAGMIEMYRTNANFDRYLADQAARYYSSLNEVLANMHHTITEADGTVTQYQYEGTQFLLEDGGTYSGSTIVRYRISFICRDRIIL